MFKFLWTSVLMLSTVVGLGQVAERQKQFNLPASRVAIQGCDPVAYFADNKAVKGLRSFTAQYQGVTYYFKSQRHLDLFTANPLKYEPEYGGWCAYAMGAKGEKVEIDPETFKVVNEKLYLFYNSFFNNTLTSWNKDEVNLKKKADNHWKTLYKTSE